MITLVLLAALMSTATLMAVLRRRSQGVIDADMEWQLAAIAERQPLA